MPHLETDIGTACQLSCCGCNHLVPLWREAGVWRSEPEQVARDLNHLATIMHAGAWGALGGEPLLHPQLVDILKIARESKVADKIEVWTNGMLVVKQSWEFWQSFDVLVLSRYEGKLDDLEVERIAEKCAQQGVELVIKDERTWHNFRANLEAVPTNSADTRIKFDGCFFRQFSRVANRGYFFTCCCAPHMPQLLQNRELGADGIAINGLTEDGLQAYLLRSEPLGCCTICAGRDTAKPIEWNEERDPVRWIEKSKGLSML